MLSPVACAAGFAAGLIGALAGSGDSGGDVQRWAAEVDSPSAAVVWVETSSLLALGVAVALTVATLIVEYVLLVRRDSADANHTGRRAR